MSTNGLHHVTAISGPASRNLDFYVNALGLRLVKKTVNFDDPGTYHLYYGDETGQPGTIITFFPWDQVAPGQLGTGETQQTLFQIPAGSVTYWTDRFTRLNITHQPPAQHFGETVIPFTDPDGMRLGLVATATTPGWTGGTVPAEHTITGFHSVNLRLTDAGPTGAILTDVFGFYEVAREGSVIRFKAGDTAIGGIVDIDAVGRAARGRLGGGSVHHIAFRAPDDAAQAEMVRKLVTTHGIQTTEQKDRNYFRSVYFRAPDGVLFEIATDIPGFDADEPAETLGQSLKLPRFLEPRRQAIEAVLPALA